MHSVKVIGVHPIEADEPCHLIELAICDPDHKFNVDDLTQAIENSRKDFWQVAYDEKFLDVHGLQPSHERPDKKEYRLAFFFHYLDLAKPLQTSFGPVALLPPSPQPEHLAFMIYGPP
jgi:hypothetical protein